MFPVTVSFSNIYLYCTHPSSPCDGLRYATPIPELCGHPLLAINCLVSLVSMDNLKNCHRLDASWYNMLPPTGTCFLFTSSTNKFNAFPTLAKHLSRTVAVTFSVWDETAKLAQIYFHNFMDRRFTLTIDQSNLSMTFFPYWEHSPFHAKEALYGFSLAHLNCQRHYSCA